MVWIQICSPISWVSVPRCSISTSSSLFPLYRSWNLVFDWTLKLLKTFLKAIERCDGSIKVRCVTALAIHYPASLCFHRCEFMVRCRYAALPSTIPLHYVSTGVNSWFVAVMRPCRPLSHFTMFPQVWIHGSLPLCDLADHYPTSLCFCRCEFTLVHCRYVDLSSSILLHYALQVWIHFIAITLTLPSSCRYVDPVHYPALLCFCRCEFISLPLCWPCHPLSHFAMFCRCESIGRRFKSHDTTLSLVHRPLLLIVTDT
jgi:hypothetical protein